MDKHLFDSLREAYDRAAEKREQGQSFLGRSGIREARWGQILVNGCWPKGFDVSSVLGYNPEQKMMLRFAQCDAFRFIPTTDR